MNGVPRNLSDRDFQDMIIEKLTDAGYSIPEAYDIWSNQED